MLLRQAASDNALTPPRGSERERYGVALASTGAALAATLLLRGTTGDPIMILFAVAVMVSAWYGGWKAGLLSAVASVLANLFLVLPLPNSAILGKQDAIRLGLFALSALLICAFMAALHSTQEALRLSQEIFRRAQRSAGIAAFEWKLSTGQVVWAEELTELKNPTSDQTFEGWMEQIHPDDRETVRHRLQQAILDRSDYEVECRMMNAEGHSQWVALRGQALAGPAGQPERVLGVAIDIHKRRLAEEALGHSEHNFRSLVEHAPYGICRANLYGELLDVNPALAEMLGYASADDLLGLHSFAAIYADPEQYVEALERFQTRERFSGVEADWKRQNGTQITVRLSGRPVHNSIEGFEIFAENLSEQRALELLFRQSQKMEAVGRLAGGIAHDFNNLLMVISGYTELMQDELGTAHPLQRNLEGVRKASQRATSLTQQLLAFSRKQVLAPKVFELNAVVSDLGRMLPRLVGEDVDLVIVPCTERIRAKADLGQLEQVIMNLAVNARDAMPNGGRLTIETGVVEFDHDYARLHPPAAAGRYAMLAVTDTGAGMDAETQSHIFEPFFTTKEKGKGTGLGLSTVYGIVKQSGGYVWVYSELGRGTTFKVYLPLADAAQATYQPEPALAADPPGMETVLLVEDEEGVRRVAREFLEIRGYTVLEAANGEEALQIAHAHPGPVHLLLTDVVMPGINGRELWQRLSWRPEMKVLYMSGYPENAIIQDGTLEEGVMYLQKPFTLNALTHKVREALHHSTAEPARRPPPEGGESWPIRGDAKGPAPRYTFHLPMRYRVAGEDQWSTGKLENVSRSGLLFHADQAPPARTRIEITLTLPVELGGCAAPEVLCHAEVVRLAKAVERVPPPAVAARILDYSLLNGFDSMVAASA
ncbi:MAG: PAS domain S-box protein [Acidobacteriota bacterium]|nr:PAS domain S-box protein [Acidobacteriota bacterium]